MTTRGLHHLGIPVILTIIHRPRWAVNIDDPLLLLEITAIILRESLGSLKTTEAGLLL